MIELNIPGRGLIQLQHLVCDVNGTLAVDGQLPEGVKQRLSVLRDRLTLHLLTADTHGKQDAIDQQLNLKAVRIQPGNEAEQKAAFVQKLGAAISVAIGQGANDAAMLRTAALGICVLSPEGTALETLLASDLVVSNICEALDLLDKPTEDSCHLTQMSLPKTEYIPDDPDLMPPARRRRARRLLAPLEADERAIVLDQLRRRTSPSFDFFLFSVVSGIIFCIGLMLDSPVVLVLGAIFAPLMAPVIGLSLATVVGSYKFFARSLVGLAIGSIMVFIVGAGAGILGRVWMPASLGQAYLNAELSATNFIVLTVGAVLTAATMVHHERSPSAPSIALAYTLYLPLVVAGFGLGSGLPHLFPDALVVFAIHLAWGALLGAITLAILGFRPMTILGYTLGGVVTLIGLALVVGVGAYSTTLGWFGAPLAVPTYTPTSTYTLTPTPTVPPTPTRTVHTAAAHAHPHHHVDAHQFTHTHPNLHPRPDTRLCPYRSRIRRHHPLWDQASIHPPSILV